MTTKSSLEPTKDTATIIKPTKGKLANCGVNAEPIMYHISQEQYAELEYLAKALIMAKYNITLDWFRV